MKYVATPLCALVILVSTAAFAQSPPSSPAPIKVMVLGSYHFDNPGHDLHNMKVESVLTPAKQADLVEVATRLAKFNPTRIAVEALSDRPDLTAKKFDGFTAETLKTDADERIQIAFRLASQLHQKSVYGIDEQSDTVDYFPFDKVQTYAKSHGQEASLGKLQDGAEQLMKQMETAQKNKSVREMLADLNEPARIVSEQRSFYYGLLALGDAKEQPGAELNAAWYQRNAKIFAKLTQIAQPGDRVLVVFGAGHSFWLRHFVQNTAGFELVEALDFLR